MPDEGSPQWLSLRGGQIRLDLLIQAGAKKSAVLGEHNGCLKLKIAAPPVEGAANKAIIHFLAKLLGVRKNEVRIIQGEFSKRKLVEVSSPSLQWTTKVVTEALLQAKG